ncbi:E3 ubiquitin-protein ligase TRIM71-like [Stylophora pistillata]|uniref:E3 ubiquitin-protein ligase TRIM71-like n=1 Tax=Stylophora pistillata TaxID=50429 RepID=UPI000C04EB4B|nr:E3 ubiquitin-protein ligase TRIM71-like [Stylophora pistillata]
MESLLKNLGKKVTCSICLDTYTKPKTIACLHTFCLKCLEEHALKTQRQGQFRCPDCQAQVKIPEENCFDNLPTGFLQNSLLSLLAVRESGDGSQISCGICKKKSAEISYCFACEKLLCHDCVNAHELFRESAFQGHKVTAVKQFQPADYEALLKRQSFCPQPYHEREVTRFFCLECQNCLCQVCINTDHKNQNIDPLDKAADAEKANILAVVESIDEKMKVCSDAIKTFQRVATELERNITAAKHEVSQTAEEMISKIREYEREATKVLENTRVSRMEKINSMYARVESLMKQLEQAVEFANNLVQGSSSSDIMKSKKTLEERFDDLSKTTVPALQVGSFVKFISTFSIENLSPGFVTTSEIDTRPWTIERLTENLQAGLKAEFLICPKSKSEEELTNRGQSKSDVKVLIEPAEDVASLTNNETGDENFQLKFVPKVPGTYNIKVEINGDKLVTSPLRVYVQERRIDVVGELVLKGEIPKKLNWITVNSKGTIAVSDKEKHCILIFDKDGNFVRKCGCYGERPGQLKKPAGITFLNDDELLVADDDNHRIQQFNVQTGNFVKSFGKEGTGDGEFRGPEGICVNDEGHIVVADYGNNRIQVLNKDGTFRFKFGEVSSGWLNEPCGCIYHKNKFIVSDIGNECLKVFDSSGKFLYKIGEEGGADGQFLSPWGLCIEKYGDHHSLLVCDRGNRRIQQFTMEGRFVGKTVTPLTHSKGIATTPDGRILVSDCFLKKIYFLK